MELITLYPDCAVILFGTSFLRNLCFSARASLEDRLKLEEHSGTGTMADTAVGSKQLTFSLKKVNQPGAPSSVCPATRSSHSIQLLQSNQLSKVERMLWPGAFLMSYSHSRNILSSACIL